jgi:hypothetical protein
MRPYPILSQRDYKSLKDDEKIEGTKRLAVHFLILKYCFAEDGFPVFCVDPA